MGTNNQKRISVCIAAYRPNDYLLTELESIMPQLSDCDEVIISEDYSIESHVYESVKRKWGGERYLSININIRILGRDGVEILKVMR